MVRVNTEAWRFACHQHPKTALDIPLTSAGRSKSRRVVLTTIPKVKLVTVVLRGKSVPYLISDRISVICVSWSLLIIVVSRTVGDNSVLGLNTDLRVLRTECLESS